MSSLAVEVRGTESAIAAARKRMGDRRERVRQECTRFGIETQAYVRENKLHGDPLHQRSGDLSNSIRWSVEFSNGAFTVFVFSLGGREGRLVVPYAKVHEFGGTFTVPAHQRRTATLRGEVVTLKNLRRANKRGSFGLAGVTSLEGSVEIGMVREYTVTYPMRSFLRSSQRERAPIFLERMKATGNTA